MLRFRFHIDLFSGSSFAQNICMCSGLVNLGGGTEMFMVGGAQDCTASTATGPRSYLLACVVWMKFGAA